MSRVVLLPLLVLLAAPFALAGGGGHATGPDAVQPGQTLSRTFDAPGEFVFYCRPHPAMTMTVVVTDDPDAQTQGLRAAIANYTFKPDRVVIPVGSTFTWSNADDVAHTVTMKDAAPVVEPEEARFSPVPAAALLVVAGLLVALLRKGEGRGRA